MGRFPPALVVLPPGPEGRRRDQRKNLAIAICRSRFKRFLFILFLFYKFLHSNIILYTICAYTIIAVLKSLCLEFLKIGPEILRLLRPVAMNDNGYFQSFCFGPDRVCFVHFDMFFSDVFFVFVDMRWVACLFCTEMNATVSCFKLLFNIALLDTQFLAVKQ